MHHKEIVHLELYRLGLVNSTEKKDTFFDEFQRKCPFLFVFFEKHGPGINNYIETRNLTGILT